MKCERCGGSLLWDDGEYCINCGWRPSYAPAPSSIPYPTLKLRLGGRASHYRADIYAPQIADRPAYQADIVTPQIADRPARFRKRWTLGELEYLANYYGLISDKHLAGRLHRTEDSIIKRAWYERISQKSGFYTARTLAQVLGVPTPRTIILWKKKGWLRGQRSEKSQSKNRVWRFTAYDVISCLKKHPWLVDLNGGALLPHTIIQIVRGSTIQAFLKQRSPIQSFLKQRRAIRSLTNSPAGFRLLL